MAVWLSFSLLLWFFIIFSFFDKKSRQKLRNVLHLSLICPSTEESIKGIRTARLAIDMLLGRENGENRIPRNLITFALSPNSAKRLNSFENAIFTTIDRKEKRKEKQTTALRGKTLLHYASRYGTPKHVSNVLERVKNSWLTKCDIDIEL